MNLTIAIDRLSGAHSSDDDSAPVKPGASYIKSPSIERIRNNNVVNDQTNQNILIENKVNLAKFMRIENESN